MSGIVFFLSLAYAILSATLAVVSTVAWLHDGHSQSTSLFIYTGLLAYLSLCLFFAFRSQSRSLNPLFSCLLLCLVWVTVPLFSAPPIMLLSGLPFSLAFYEAVSGFTTTGLTVFQAVENESQALLFLRSSLQWWGGFFTLSAILLVLAPNAIGGLPKRYIYMFEGTANAGLRRIGQIMRTVMIGYASITIMCIIAMLIVGASLSNTINLSLSVVSTGGFAPSSAPLNSYLSSSIEFVLTFFMILGGTSIAWQKMMLERRVDFLLNHREVYLYLATIFVVAIIIGAQYFQSSQGTVLLEHALLEGIYSAASLISTTGLPTNINTLSALPITCIFLITLVGACSFSTGGGLNFYRVGGMFIQSTRELTKLVYPNVVRRATFGSQDYDVEIIKAVWSHFFASILLIALCTCILAITSFNFEGALLLSLASYSNVGGIYADMALHTQSYSHISLLPMVQHITSAALMILGKLNVLALFAAVNWRYWAASR